MEGKPGRGPLLDHHDDAGAGGSFNTQTQMRTTAYDLVSVEANLRSKLRRACCAGRSQNQVVVRFWIITMMLVLVGLSALKLR
jgi:UDP-N-acetylmuramyl pentapeptide phosphotransferase/UDP-N-acetylglucosamine-1-phosphate transferase